MRHRPPTLPQNFCMDWLKGLTTTAGADAPVDERWVPGRSHPVPKALKEIESAGVEADLPGFLVTTSATADPPRVRPA